MKETNLKKEFKQRDVQRMRNIITGKTGDRTTIQAGYEKKQQDHKEGDFWEEGGKTWTIKNGIRQTVTKYDKFKKLFSLPLSCPNCKKPMKDHQLNRKMHSIHGMCFDCVIEMEHEIKKTGQWESYESKQVNTNKNMSLADFEQALNEWYKEKESFISESGEVESWEKVDKTKVFEEVKQWIEEMKQTDIYSNKT